LKTFSSDAHRSSASLEARYRADKDIRQLLANNAEWCVKKREEDPSFFEKVGSNKRPRYLYGPRLHNNHAIIYFFAFAVDDVVVVGCSDARVPANEILGLPPGKLF